jgi:hypothetical protein
MSRKLHGQQRTPRATGEIGGEEVAKCLEEREGGASVSMTGMSVLQKMT